LDFLDEHTLPDDVWDGFYEALYEKGFTDKQLRAVIDLGLAEYRVEQAEFDPDSSVEVVGIFILTPLGRSTRNELAA
jgi:hypothetical protein